MPVTSLDDCQIVKPREAASAPEQRHLHALPADPGVVRGLPNPVDLAEFASPVARGRFRRRFGLPDAPGARLVMFLGKLTPRKRVDVLVRAFAQLDRQDAR